MKTHSLSVTHLVVGLIFLGVAGSWALRQGGVIHTTDMSWLIPVSLIVAGGIGLVAASTKGMRGKREVETPATAYDAPPVHDYTSDLDRRLDEARKSAADTTTTDTTTTETTVIDTNEGETR